MICSEAKDESIKFLNYFDILWERIKAPLAASWIIHVPISYRINVRMPLLERRVRQNGLQNSSHEDGVRQ